MTILDGIRQKTGRNVKYIPGCSLTRSEVTESMFSLLTTPDGQRGMKATYWNNTAQEGQPAATCVFTESINQSNGGATVFAPGVNLTSFSARYEATLRPSADLTLTLATTCDDRLTLKVNGTTLISAEKEGKKVKNASRNYSFRKGKTYSITIDYTQLDGSATMRFDITKSHTPTLAETLNEIGTAETIVFVGGISPRLEGEEMKVSEPGFRGGDRTDIELPAVQRRLVAALKAAGKRIVFVNCSGGAMGLVPESRNCEAILQAWYGGEKGGEAVADILFGDYNPSGKLPLTFYKDASQLPDFEDYRMANRTYRYFSGEPQWAFGHGLSYTTFEVDNPRYDKALGRLTLTLKNTGSRSGTATVQVYIKRTADTAGPIKTLRAYTRVGLDAGRQRDVTIDLPATSFETWDEATQTMRVVGGRHEIMVGTSSDNVKTTSTTL